MTVMSSPRFLAPSLAHPILQLVKCVGLALAATCLAGCVMIRTPDPPVPMEDGMPLADQETISAQVVLKPAGGKTLDSMTAITSSNIADYTPSAEAVAQTTATFRGRL